MDDKTEHIINKETKSNELPLWLQQLLPYIMPYIEPILSLVYTNTKDTKDKNYASYKINMLVIICVAVILVLSILIVGFLSYVDKLSASAGIFFGTLIGYLFGKTGQNK